MTLTKLLPAVQDLPAADKLTLFHVLAEQLDSGEDISPLVPGKVYSIETPYDMVGVGEALLDAMQQVSPFQENKSLNLPQSIGV